MRGYEAMNAFKIIRNDKGLTLVELMIVLVLSLLLMAAVYMTYQIQHSTSQVQHEVAGIQQDLRAVLDIMAVDIRLAGCDPTLNSTAGITAAQTGPTSLTFSMDLNEDGDTDDTNPDEQVAFSLSGTDLLRNGVALASNVTTFGFVYYNENNTQITPTGGGGSFFLASEADDIRDVEINIQVQSANKDPDLDQYINRSMTRRIRLRNQGI